MAKKEFTQLALNYMSFCWNGAQALQVIEDNWSIHLDTVKQLKLNNPTDFKLMADDKHNN